ncbi:hypothetical protein FACS1894137_15430 [Spirochaetia bacterium]|nr:hypothetical protein FACS1894137_15430 [Spirochaetia bacterium]
MQDEADTAAKDTHDENAIHWHPAFVAAIRLELAEYKDVLEFTAEHQLTTEPLRIDLLIIKKPPDVVIEKAIAAIFRSVNVVEYKSPTDYVSVDDFYKVHAYAYLYASLEKAAITDITLTLIESHHPRILIKHIKEVLHFSIEENTPGIYTVIGDVLPVQIIDSRKLSPDESIWLKNLRTKLGAAEAWRMNRVRNKPIDLRYDREDLSTYYETLFKANPVTFKEVLKMSKAEQTMDQVLEEYGLPTKWVARGKSEEKFETARNGLAKGIPLETLSDLTGLPVETIQKLASG